MKRPPVDGGLFVFRYFKDFENFKNFQDFNNFKRLQRLRYTWGEVRGARYSVRGEGVKAILEKGAKF